MPEIIIPNSLKVALSHFNTEKTWLARSLRILLGLLSIVLVLSLASIFILPPVIKQLASEQSKLHLGRTLEIAEVHVSPWRLSVRLDDLRLSGADQKNSALSIQQIELNFSIASLYHRALVMDEIKLQQPVVSIVRFSQNGKPRYDFSDILEKLSERPDAPETTQTLLFALANLHIDGGKLGFEDRITKQTISIENFSVGLPFASNFPADLNSFIEPHLSATINGAQFQLKARSKAFTEPLDTILALDIEHFDLAKYSAYFPLELPVQLKSAELNSRLDVSFSRKNTHPQLLISGDIGLTKLKLNDLQGQPLIQIQTVQSKIKEWDVLASRVSLDKLQIQEPQVWLALLQNNTSNWDGLFQPEKTSAVKADGAKINEKKSKGAKANGSKTNPAKSDAAAKTTSPTLVLNQFNLSNGIVHLSDTAFNEDKTTNQKPVKRLDFSKLSLQAQHVSSDINSRPVRFSFSAEAEHQQTLKIEGSIESVKGQIAASQKRLTELNASITLDKLHLAAYQPYISRLMAAKLSGDLSLQSQLKLQLNPQHVQWQLSETNLQLQEFKLDPDKIENGAVALKSIQLQNLSADSVQRALEIKKIAIAQLNAEVKRDTNAVFNFQKILKSATVTASEKKPVELATVQPQPELNPEWRFKIDEFALLDSAINLSDQSVSPELKLRTDALSLSIMHLNSDFSQPLQLNTAMRINRSGKLSVAGQGTQNLQQVTAKIDVQSFPLADFYPYFAPQVNARLVRGKVNLKGQINLENALPMLSKKPLNARYAGMLSLNEVEILENGANLDFLEWKSIRFDGIDANYAAAHSSLSIDKLSFNDFYARLILSDKGSLNLATIFSKPATTVLTATSAAQEGANLTVQPTDRLSEQTLAKATEHATEQKNLPANFDIKVKQTVFNGGNINFSDNFIKPNYKANLTGLSGSLSMLSSDPKNLSEVQLNGKIDNEAPLLISGKIQAFSKPLFAEITGSANGIELSRLSAYSGKYAGYSISGGKLSVQVAYHLENQSLAADNQIRLDSLKFGERLDSSEATKLPVNLALALLRDKDGLISINLPVSGSLSDPQFSVGGIVWKMLSNLLMKAITSPFSLLSSAFGTTGDDGAAGDAMSFAQFAPGSAQLNPPTLAKLSHLGNILKEKDNLKIDVMGRADAQADAKAYQLAQLEDKLKRAKSSNLQKTALPASLEQVQLDATERHRYLQEIYQTEKFEHGQSKPKNFLGLDKSLDDAQVTQMLLKNIIVDDEVLHRLAQARAQVVIDYLVSQGGIKRERIFLKQDSINDVTVMDETARTRVEFSLRLD